ncbi:hypothetical protein GCM10009838_79310 [Catenulispora subtropica]|uniref:Uncharacterized protein n=1 Tax=Catenulispora subtropica TaxID=450798 RepID=A0ABN2T8F7_9ACTN
MLVNPADGTFGIDQPIEMLPAPTLAEASEGAIPRVAESAAASTAAPTFRRGDPSTRSFPSVDVIERVLVKPLKFDLLNPINNGGPLSAAGLA